MKIIYQREIIDIARKILLKEFFANQNFYTAASYDSK